MKTCVVLKVVHVTYGLAYPNVSMIIADEWLVSTPEESGPYALLLT